MTGLGTHILCEMVKTRLTGRQTTKHLSIPYGLDMPLLQDTRKPSELSGLSSSLTVVL